MASRYVGMSYSDGVFHKVYVEIPDGDDSAEIAEIQAALSGKVDGSGITDIVGISQTDFDELTPDENTLYVITGP